MTDEPEKSEILKLHDRIRELEHRVEPVLVKVYLKLKEFLNAKIHESPVSSVYVSGFLGAAAMYVARKWLSF